MRISFRTNVPKSLEMFLEYPTPMVTETMSRADKLALMLMQESAKTNIWHNRTGALKNSITIDVKNRKLTTDLIYASAQEKGHYAEPINAKMLHFTDQGKDVFLHFTRSKAHPFFFKALSQNKQQILEIYDEAFKKLLERV